MYLQDIFYCKGKKHHLTLNGNILSWKSEATSHLFHSVLLSEIISCWLCPRGSLQCCSSNSEVKECFHDVQNSNRGLTIEICCRRKKSKWVSSIIVFKHEAQDTLLTWHEAIWATIKDFKDRPRKLFVVINPVGGKKKAEAIFRKQVQPLFFRAGIEITTAKTNYRGHGTVLAQGVSDEGLLTNCDGIIAVGGDGLVNEIAMGLFISSAQNLGLDPHDSKIDLPVTDIRLGIIPSGSTDAACFASHGSSDPITAALHIIMGDRRGVDIAAIHTDDQLERIVTTMVSYGYFGDLLRSSERMRCIGPFRYILSGIQQIMRNRSYPVRIKVRRGDKLTETESQRSSGISSTISCNSICSVCTNYCDDTERLIKDLPDEGLTEISGKFSVVSSVISSCACRLSPQGMSPTAHLGDGQTDIILVKGSSRLKLLSYIFHTGYTGNAGKLEHVKMIRTNEAQISLISNTNSSWNCDGEILDASFLNIKVHRQKLNLFCRGIEDPHQMTTCQTKIEV